MTATVFRQSYMTHTAPDFVYTDQLLCQPISYYARLISWWDKKLNFCCL